MTTLSRWNPWQEMAALNSAMDRVFAAPNVAAGTEPLPMDLYETEQEFVAKFAMPGLTPENFDLTWHEQTLTVRAHTQLERPSEARFHAQEHVYGAFSRSLRFPSAIDPDRIEASLANGVLMVRIPKSEAAKPKKINVIQS